MLVDSTRFVLDLRFIASSKNVLAFGRNRILRCKYCTSSRLASGYNIIVRTCIEVARVRMTGVVATALLIEPLFER